jgi:RNA recognition motif-containing protein
MASGDPDAQVALKMRGLPWSCEEAEVLEFFEGFKIVEEEGVKFGVYEDGRKSGNACVKFETPEECARAKSEKEGEKIGHRWINLLPARASDHD